MCIITGRMPHMNLLTTVTTTHFKSSSVGFTLKPDLCVMQILLYKKGSQHIHNQKAGPQSHKQHSLQYNDLVGTHQIQTWMKDRGKAPPTRLLYVP